MTAFRSVVGAVLLVVASLCGAGKALAAQTSPVTAGHSVATLVTDTDVITPGRTFSAALILQLAPGWHTYWQNPGDAGVAPELSLSSGTDAAMGPLQWPLPMKSSEGPLTTYGYQSRVVLPFTILPRAAPLGLHLHASWLVCRDVCVPEETEFALPLAAGTPSISAQAGVIADAVAKAPLPAPFTAAFSESGLLHLSGPALPKAIRTLAFYPINDGVVNTADAAPATVEPDGLTAPIAIGAHAQDAHPIHGVVALTDEAGKTTAYTISAAPAYLPAAAPQSAAMLMLLALAGGLLLNLMPCVFPILAMKAMALARLSGAQGRIVRQEAGSYTAGVVLAFVALGGGLLALRGAGHAVGWGFQFQSTGFVTAIAWLLFATGLNMSGVFSLGDSLAGAGSGLAARRGHMGSFFTGLLAVVVATPCTASFMAAAVAGALAQPVVTALLVFAALGAGMALPYAAIAAVPRLAAIIPRPGRWMLLLRGALAFPMYGASVWLVWVASQQAGASAVLVAGTGLVVIGFAAWTLGLAQNSTAVWTRRAAFSTVALCAVAAAILLIASGSTAAPETTEPYSAARLAELRSEGRPVFVNMTAAWCLSCLVNERLALSPAPVQQAFAQAHVVYLKGDWTRQDPAISEFLHANGRDGVPLYIFYPPDRAPVVLPQLLTEGVLLDQLRSAGG